MKLFKGQVEVTSKDTIKINDFRDCVEVFDENGNQKYCENSTGFWSRREFDENGKERYFENSHGVIKGNRLKLKELSVAEVSKLLGYEVKIINKEDK